MRLHHIAFRTDDVDRLVDFYGSLFELPEVHDARPRSVWLGLEGTAVLMIERRETGETSRGRDLELVAFEVSDAQKSKVRERARARAAYEGETPHTVYVRDPDGRRVGVSTYPLPPR